MKKPFPVRRRVAVAAAAVASSLFAQAALAVNITVRDASGAPVTTAVRWVLEEDRTYDVAPGITGTPAAPNPGETLSLRFHRSYMPVVATGESSGAVITIPNAQLDPAKRYFLSLLPRADAAGNGLYSMTGVPIRPQNGTFPAALNAVVDNLPLKTAQISVLLYHDANPVNAQADAIGSQEFGLCGFEVHLYDAGHGFACDARASYDAASAALAWERTIAFLHAHLG